MRMVHTGRGTLQLVGVGRYVEMTVLFLFWAKLSRHSQVILLCAVRASDAGRRTQRTLSKSSSECQEGPLQPTVKGYYNR